MPLTKIIIEVKKKKNCAKREDVFLLVLGWILMFPTSLFLTLPPHNYRKIPTSHKKFKVFVTKTGCYVNKDTFLLEMSNFFLVILGPFSLFS